MQIDLWCNTPSELRFLISFLMMVAWWMMFAMTAMMMTMRIIPGCLGNSGIIGALAPPRIWDYLRLLPPPESENYF